MTVWNSLLVASTEHSKVSNFRTFQIRNVQSIVGWAQGFLSLFFTAPMWNDTKSWGGEDTNNRKYSKKSQGEKARYRTMFVKCFCSICVCGVCMCTCSCRCAHGAQRSTLDVLLYCSPPCFFRLCLSLTLELANWAGLAGQSSNDPLVFALLQHQGTDTGCHTNFSWVLKIQT